MRHTGTNAGTARKNACATSGALYTAKRPGLGMNGNTSRLQSRPAGA